MRTQTLKWRIGIFTAIALCIAITVISGIAYYEFREAMIDSLDYRLQSDTNTISNIVQGEISQENALIEIAAIASSKTNPLRSSYRIWFEGDEESINSNQKIESLFSSFTKSHPSIKWKNGFFLDEIVEDDKPLRLVWAKYSIQFENEITPLQLNIFGIISASHAHNEMEEFLRALLIISAIVIWASIASLFGALRWGLRPIEEMINKMESFSGHLFTRPPMNPKETVEELRPFVNSWNQMLKRLSVAIDENKRFTADASHELRTPLALIKSTLQLARSQKRTTEEYEKAIDESLEDLDRVNLLTDKLLELSRLDSTLLEESFKPLDIKQLTEDILQQYQPVAARQGKTISAALCRADIRGDRIQLQQMLRNLLDNAIRYSPDNSTITVSIKTTEASVKITVHDEGGNISTQDQEKIFERFYRIDKARDRKSGGTGLGLAIAYQIALQHNGMITVTSSPEAGTGFTITLPLS